MQVRIGEMQVEISEEEMVEAIITFVNNEEGNCDYFQHDDFELCNVTHEGATGDVKILLGMRTR